MKKLLYVLFAVGFCSEAFAADVVTDTADPLFLQTQGRALVQGGLEYFETGLRLGTGLSYGFTDRFALGARVHYQQDFAGSQDGFSSVDLGGIYRVGDADESDNDLVHDILFGMKFGGSHRVRMPGYADSTYYVGMRLGRQYAGVTLAGTIKSTWIFDDDHGMAYIDFIPEIYFRTSTDWRVGAGFNLRKATESSYNEEILDFKLVRQYGATQYIGYASYAFEAEDIGAGIKVNILF